MNSNRDKNRDNSELADERSPELKGDLQAQLDDLGDDPAQVGENSAGQSVSSQGLSHIRESNEESVEELSDTDQALESMRKLAALDPAEVWPGHLGPVTGDVRSKLERPGSPSA